MDATLLQPKDYEPHTHKCGFTRFAFGVEADNSSVGCGYEWSHTYAEMISSSPDAFVDGHNCPRCGLGPWTWHYSDETVAQGRMTPVEQHNYDAYGALMKIFGQLLGGSR